MVERDLGTEIVTLRSEFRKLPARGRVLAAGDRFTEVRRCLDQRFALARMTRSRRTELVKERAWLVAEVKGYRQGLALAGGDATGLRRHLERRAAAAERLGAEIEEVDRRIESIELDIAGLQSEMVEILRRSIADSEEKIRRAAAARRRRLARKLGDVGGNTTWSPVAVMGYRSWKWSDAGFYGVRQQWLHPRLAAACLKGDGLPHTDGRCAEVAYGCGIYAAKALDPVLKRVRIPAEGRVAVGVVGLEGKVVEHERGYRAEIATVLALVLIGIRHLYLVEGAGRIMALFARPEAVSRLGAACLPLPGAQEETWALLSAYLGERARRNQGWISGNPSE